MHAVLAIQAVHAGVDAGNLESHGAGDLLDFFAGQQTVKKLVEAGLAGADAQVQASGKLFAAVNVLLAEDSLQVIVHLVEGQAGRARNILAGLAGEQVGDHLLIAILAKLG